MKCFATLIFCLSLFNPKDFEVISSTSKKWAGGIMDAGRGINYSFALLAKKSSKKLIINQLWIGQKFYEVKACGKFPSRPEDGFSKNDTIYIYANERIDEKNQPSGNPDKLNPPPVEYKGEALIGYKINGKQKFKIVKEIKPLEAIYYP